MASFELNGQFYYFVGGKWVDAVSSKVKPDIAEALNAKYGKNGIVEKQPVVAVKKKIKAGYSVGGASANVTKTLGTTIKTSGATIKTQKFSCQDAWAQRNMKSKTETKKPLAKQKNADTGSNTKKAVNKNKYYHRIARTTTYQKNVELTKDQKRALAILESGKNVFLSGEAGTGKSFVLNEFIRRNKNKNIIVCAPTGIAAINVGGSTLHRVFKIPIGVLRPNEYNMKPEEAVINADIIVIDEISMCRFDLFEYIIRTIRCAESIKQIQDNEKAFEEGTMLKINEPKQIIVVGDFYQLEPVINGNDEKILFTYWNREKYSSRFAFLSDMWKELNFKNVVLKEIVRQKGDEEFITNLNKIRKGDINGIAWFNSHVSKEVIPNGIYICGRNKEADDINQRKSNEIESKEITYNAKITGQVGENDKMTADNLTLKVGMQVMTLVNNIEEGYQNGSIGKITALYPDKVEIMLNNGRNVSVVPYTWEILGYEMQNEKLEKIVLGDFQQMPIKIAYAITIHKSQGQTYSSVNILPKCFANGQLYVALSRAQSIDGMRIEYNIPRSSLKTSQAVKAFYEDLEEQ